MDPEKIKETAKHDKDCFNFLHSSEDREFMDWEIVTLFYSAALYIEYKIFKEEMKKVSSHKERKCYVLSKNYFNDEVEESYLDLKDEAHKACYKPWFQKRNEEIIQNQLKKLEKVKEACVS